MSSRRVSGGSANGERVLPAHRRPGTMPRAPLTALLAGLVTALIAVLVPVAPLPSAFAQTAPAFDIPDTLVFEVWTVRDRIVYPEGEAERRLLDIARRALSGMLYGYDVHYAPHDPVRRVNGFFELRPRSEVAWGDAAMELRELALEDNALYGQFTYRLDASQLSRLRMYRHNRAVVSHGQGYGSLYEGAAGYAAALEAAIEDALRRHLQSITRNRPREAAGFVALTEPPRVRITAGQFHARVSILIDLEELRSYLTD